ncbi:hypothetical protein SAMN05216267_10854 [Actinacidiphila rubida]|uniref:Uncharacterized protein n=2 Tax=Actinacidiphila rubida TaxID=310780 RepID=A0A1H8UT51_9ACTN|nr:hypothetical protein SAMN05216267_10854 [Actinacidiphila rubida]
MMRGMTEGHGQQPSQHPSPDAPEGREVLEGRIIPSSRQQQRSFEAQQPHEPSAYDPRQQFAAGPGAQGEPWSAASDAQAQQGRPGQPGQPGLYGAAPQGGQTGPGGQAEQDGQPPLPHRDGPAAARPGPHQASLQQPPDHPQLPQAATPEQPGQAPQGPRQDPGAPRGRHAGPQQGVSGQADFPMQQSAAPQQGVPQQGFPQQQGAAPQPGFPQQGFPQQQAPAQGPGPQGYGRQPAAAGPPRQNAAQAPSAPRRAASSGGPGTPPGTPDWNALAERQEATGARRRKVMMLTGGIVAIVVIAGGVATAVVMSGKNSGDGKNSATSGPSSSGTKATQSLPPAPSFSSVAPPPPANPLDYLSTAAKDTAPLTPATLFPGKQFLMNGRVYAKTATSVTTQCAAGARAGLSQALGKGACRKLIRATYTNGTTAVTVGVAVFDDAGHAQKLQKVAQYLAPLNGGGVQDFCHAVACRMTSNAVGRYAYFAIAGLKDGKTITATDKVALASANDASNFAFQRIIQRGRDAAAADPSRT